MTEYQKLKVAREHLKEAYAKAGIELKYSTCRSEWPNKADFIFACAKLGYKVKL